MIPKIRYPPDTAHQPAIATPRSATNPSTLVIIIAAIVFAVEVIEPFVFHLFPPLPETTEILIDAMLMMSILSGLLFLFLMRPIMAEIAGREKAEVELVELNRQLETQVQERTTELLDANKQLVAALDRTPSQQARNLLMTAVAAFD